jgi:hypothetical protein
MELWLSSILSSEEPMRGASVVENVKGYKDSKGILVDQERWGSWLGLGRHLGAALSFLS